MPTVRNLDDVPALVKLAAERLREEKDVACLFLPFDVQPLSSNATRGRHWATLHQDSERAHAAAMWAYRMAGEPVHTGAVLLDAIFFRAEEMDDDNLWTGLKSIRDWLFKGRLAPDDNRIWVRCGKVRVIAGKEWAREPWVVLLVRARDVEDDRWLLEEAEAPAGARGRDARSEPAGRRATPRRRTRKE